MMGIELMTSTAENNQRRDNEDHFQVSTSGEVLSPVHNGRILNSHDDNAELCTGKVTTAQKCGCL